MVLEVPTKVPPHEPVYQNQFAPVPRTPPLTVRTLAVPGQIETGTAVTVVGPVEIVFIEIEILKQVELLHPVNCRQL